MTLSEPRFEPVRRPGPTGRSAGRARREQALAARALANTCALLLALLAGCRDEERDAPPPRPVATATTPAARIDELIAALTPLAETVTSDISDRKFIAGQALLAELSAGGREQGLAALEALRTLRERHGIEGAERILAVERGLLIVAARAAPLDTRPLLHSLVTEYGAALDLRTEAVLLYGETSPEQALEVLEPLVVKSRAESTMPPAEFLVAAYATACEKTGRSPVAALARVATGLFQEESARVRATKELAEHGDDPLASQALQALLVESTGDGYLRRMATQGLLRMLPNETACAILAQVADREADLNFLRFLGDALEKNCAPIDPAPAAAARPAEASLAPPK